MNTKSRTLDLVEKIGNRLTNSFQTVTTVESCTGGGIAHALTEISGSSSWIECGFVTYSNIAKMRMVGVPEEKLENYGAVSIEVAESMALGGLKFSGASYALSVTGIAGPGGGTAEKPVGTVCFGWAGPDGFIRVEKVVFEGNRSEIRSKSIEHSLGGLLRILNRE